MFKTKRDDFDDDPKRSRQLFRIGKQFQKFVNFWPETVKDSKIDGESTVYRPGDISSDA